MKESADLYTKDNDLQWIQTYKGKRFHLNDPKFDIEEIAHALSLQCRFTGHIKEFYSVAEHSILVAAIAEDLGGDKYEGLLHDAHEAYFSDLASPWKAAVPDYRKWEKSLEAAMRSHFVLKPIISEKVKEADWIALFIEADHLLVGPLDDWIAPEGVKDKAAKYSAEFAPVCWNPKAAERKFLEVYESLRPRIAA